MKFRGISIFSACMLALCALPVTASAAEVAPENIFTPLYPHDEPVAAWLDLTLEKASADMHVTIMQTSEERADLVLYDFDLIEAPAGYACRAELEPGEYTVSVTTKLLADGTMTQTLDALIEIDDPDDSDTISFTYYDMVLSEKEIEDTDAFESHVAAPLFTQGDDQARLTKQYMFINYYGRQRGDYDGDGKITASDAQRALVSASRALAELDDPDLTPGRLMACDFDHSGEIDAKDSLEILRYFAAGISELPQVWNPSSITIG